MKRFLAVSVALLFFMYCQSEFPQSEYPQSESPLSASQSLPCEAGFITIEPVDFYFHYQSYFSRLALRSSAARIWYSFHPADQDCEEKPLFIFFNGGPCGATSSGLWSFNTSKMTLDTSLENGGDEFIPNPVSWTRLGNLLHVDSRQAGFSYNLMTSPQDWEERFKEFNAQNFNIFIDAADFIRVLLRFLSDHPEIQKNPVIITGESYGGIRSNIMLHILLNYKDYANGKEIYQDYDLVDKIQAHYDTVFPEYTNQTVPPEVITTQFNHQILIQPAVSYSNQHLVTGKILEQEGSIIYQIAEEEGVEFIPSWQRPSSDPLSDPMNNISDFMHNVAERDIYNYIKPEDWFWGFFYNAATLLRTTENLSIVTGVDVTSIASLYASARVNAYKIYNESRYDAEYTVNQETDKVLSFEELLFRTMARKEAKLSAVEPGDMSEVFGLLQPWDRYFISLNYDANSAFHRNIALHRGYDVNFYAQICGSMFLKNVAYVNTFITDASYDIVVYSKAIPGSLALHTDILESSIHDTEPQGGEERGGRIILRYLPDAFPDISGLNTRTIRFPLYATSGHAVSITQPVELFSDVSDWLANTGLGDIQ